MDIVKIIAASIKDDLYLAYPRSNPEDFKICLKSINEKLDSINKEDAQKIMDCFVDLLIADYNSEKNSNSNSNLNNNLTSGIIIHLVSNGALHYLDRAKLLSGLDETFCVDNFGYATLIDCMYPKNSGKNV